MKNNFTIGKLSSITNVNIETIRYYEKKNILPSPPRTQSGYRIYSQEHVQRLIFIRKSRELGFSINEIRTLLNMIDGNNLTCAQVKKITLRHIDEIHRKIKDLQKFAHDLEIIASKCKGDNTPDCSIIDALSYSNKS